MASSDRTLIVIGSGPGIGRSVAALFAKKRYNKVALVARRAEQLEIEKKELQKAAGDQINVKTFAVDIVNRDAFLKVLDDAEAELGKPECIYFNAARVQPSQLLSHELKDIEYDLKINVSALYTVAQREIPSLIEMGKVDPASIPSIIVTNSALPEHPVPPYFALSLVKAAQRNLVQTLQMEYRPKGVHIGIVNVGGIVSPDHEVWNPPNIAAKAWEWFAQLKENPSFEVKI